MSAWILPDHIADVLPSEARHIEELRRALLDKARSYGYELVIPPLLEHLESLLSGSNTALDVQTFKLVDQLSGRSLGLRADSTPQVARIDAHLLNRQGVARLCYCGSVLHTRPAAPRATREPLQLGAEIYGHSGLESELEILSLALECLQVAKIPSLSVDLADARIVESLLSQVVISHAERVQIYAALATKDASSLQQLTQGWDAAVAQPLLALLQLYGDITVLDKAIQVLPALPLLQQALSQLRWLAEHLPTNHVTVDLSDLGGYGYYSGIRFAVYASGASDALARGGRYDAVGAVFGRDRPAVGFSMDLKALTALLPAQPLRAAIRAPWAEDTSLRQVIAHLREQGEIVVSVLPGHENEIDEFHCDRALTYSAGQWVVQSVNS